MSNIIKLGMVFDESTAPDFGDIAFDKDRNFILTSGSLSKLTDNVTKTVCGAVFSVPPGTQAFVVDTGDVLIYHPDTWRFVKRNIHTEMKYGVLRVCIKNSGANYVSGENEKIVFSVVSNSQTVISKEMTLTHYAGQGIYAYRLNMEDAHALSLLGNNYTASVAVYSGETDITSTLTIEHPSVEEWYDVYVKYDTGV